MSGTWSVDPEAWRLASAQIDDYSAKLDEGTVPPSATRNDIVQILQALADHTPDDTGYLVSLIQIIQESTDEKLAIKGGLIATEIATRAALAAGLDDEYTTRMGPP